MSPLWTDRRCEELTSPRLSTDVFAKRSCRSCSAHRASTARSAIGKPTRELEISVESSSRLVGSAPRLFSTVDFPKWRPLSARSAERPAEQNVIGERPLPEANMITVSPFTSICIELSITVRLHNSMGDTSQYRHILCNLSLLHPICCQFAPLAGAADEPFGHLLADPCDHGNFGNWLAEARSRRLSRSSMGSEASVIDRARTRFNDFAFPLSRPRQR